MTRVYEIAAQMLRVALFIGIVLAIVYSLPALTWALGAAP